MTTRPICPACGQEVSYPTMVGEQAFHFFCARRQPEPRKEPVWLSRSRQRPGGLSKDLTGAGR